LYAKKINFCKGDGNFKNLQFLERMKLYRKIVKMILNPNTQVSRNKIGYLKNNSNQKQAKPIQAKQQSSPNFKGGGLNEFANYFLADVTAIAIACGAVDAYFKKSALKSAKEYGLMLINTKHKEEMGKIESLTKEVILGIGTLKDSGNNKKIISSIKKAYDKSFKQTLELDKFDKEKKIKPKELPIKLGLLKETSNNLFVTMDNQESYTTIGKPFVEALEKAYNKLYS
jgi:hypothetical protein